MKKTRKILAIIMVVAMCFSMFSHTTFANTTIVAEGTAGEGVTWVLDSDGTLTISGTGVVDTEMYSPPWEEYIELITAVIVEEGITEIYYTAFYYAVNLVTVSIPSTVTYLTGWAFIGCESLEEINVAEENTLYKSIDGILFSKDEKNLIMYPANKYCDEYTIPSFVESVGEAAFENNQAVNTVIIPDTVSSLEESAFENANISTVIIGSAIETIPEWCFSGSSIETVIFSDSVKSIERHAFVDNYNLTAFHYKGTQDDWDAIVISEENEDLYDKELHFISDDIKEGTEPSCVDGHTEGIYCDTCEDYLTGEVITAIDEHNWNNGVCDGCSEVCAHIDEDYNKKCDICEYELEYKEVEVDETNTVYIPEEYAEVVVKYIPKESGWYAVVSDNDGDDENNDPYVAILDANGEEIEYNDDNNSESTYNFYCEFEAKAGNTYYIVLSNYNGDVKYDYEIIKHIGIDHQPTSTEPYVTLTWDVEAEYQWYSLKESIIELTDKNTIAYPSEDEGPVYDEEKGWSGIYTGSLEGMYKGYAYFIVQLKKGDTIKIELFGDYIGYVELKDMITDGVSIGVVDEDGKCEFTAKEESYYSVTAFKDVDGDDVFAKAYMNGYEYTKIEGATNSKYVPVEEALYACEVTFADGSKEMSNTFEKKSVPAGGDNTGGNTGDNTGGNTGGNTGDNSGNNTGNNAGNSENTKPVPNPEIPNTDAAMNNTNSNGWFAVMLTLSMGLVLVMATSKKEYSQNKH